MKFLTSPLMEVVPGLTHGFGERVPGTRHQARAAAESAFAFSGQVFFLKQVHGCRLASPPWTDPPEADASFTNETGTLLAIETADCLPVLIVDPLHKRVAAAHAGWRGTLSQVAAAAARALIDAGSQPKHLIAALGPAIGPCCYEVGTDVETAFGRPGEGFFVPGPGTRKHLDVVAANRSQLLEVGLDPSRIDSLNACTSCLGDLFFSYRRDGAAAGRMISVIGFSR